MIINKNEKLSLVSSLENHSESDVFKAVCMYFNYIANKLIPYKSYPSGFHQKTYNYIVTSCAEQAIKKCKKKAKMLYTGGLISRIEYYFIKLFLSDIRINDMIIDMLTFNKITIKRKSIYNDQNLFLGIKTNILFESIDPDPYNDEFKVGFKTYNFHFDESKGNVNLYLYDSITYGEYENKLRSEGGNLVIVLFAYLNQEFNLFNHKTLQQL